MKLPDWMPLSARTQPKRMLDLASGLLLLGYTPVPLGAEKKPLVKWSEFEIETANWSTIMGVWMPAWQRASGAAVITGGPRHLVVADFDDEPSWQWAQKNLPLVRGVKTRRGGHLHFSHPRRGLIGNRSGRTVVTLSESVKCDVKGLGGMATAPYSLHPSGFIYEPLGDWTVMVSELPELPRVIACQASDKMRPTPVLPPRLPESNPVRAIEMYLSKAGGIPEMGCGSDEAVFRAASWCKAKVPELRESEFVHAIRRERPDFTDQWISSKWRSAKGR